MKPTLLVQTVKALFPITRTVCIEGPPGGGKTTIVRQVAKELGVPCIERHMPTMLVEDFGILFPGDGDMLHYRLPEWFPVAGRAPEQGVLLFDDRNQAGHDLQKVMANICQARTLHGFPLPPGWMVISTGNRQSDRAGSNRVLSHLRNRETVLELETHLDDWTGWALDNHVKPEVISFIRFRPDALHDFDPQKEQNPSPRAWVEGVSNVLGVVAPEAEYECFKGAVGEGRAAEFVGFLKIFRKLPNVDAVILVPDTAVVPDDLMTCYAMAGALASRATATNFDRIVRYLSRMPAEFSVLAMSIVVRKQPELSNTQTFVRWSVDHKDVLF